MRRHSLSLWLLLSVSAGCGESVESSRALALSDRPDRCAQAQKAAGRLHACGLQEATAPCSTAGCTEEDLAAIDQYLACQQALPECDQGSATWRAHRDACARGSCGEPPNARGLYDCERLLVLRGACAFDALVRSGIDD